MIRFQQYRLVFGPRQESLFGTHHGNFEIAKFQRPEIDPLFSKLTKHRLNIVAPPVLLRCR